MAAHMSTVAALRNAIETAGVEFIEENGEAVQVRRLRKRPSEKRVLKRVVI